MLTADPHAARHPASRPQPADPGLVVEEVQTGWVGAIVRVEKSGGVHLVELEDRRGRVRSFPLGAGFWIDGEPVILTPPTPQATRAAGRKTDGRRAGGSQAAERRGDRTASGQATAGRTASGSIAVAGARARVARASRIWVEGRHDAELVERVWGDDLRLEGVVVEMLDGADNLVAAARAFQPGPGRRLGVLVDHLVAGSKESRIAAEARAACGEDLLVLGHPYIDVWQAVLPQRLGLRAWPHIERGQEWKRGILAELGWPSTTQADVASAWARILGSVRDYRDLDPALLGRVEELIDFVTT